MDALLRRRSMIAAGGGSPTPPGPVVEPVFYDRLVFDGVAKIETSYVLPENCSIRVSLSGETSKAAQRVFKATGNGLIQVIYGSTTTTTKRTVNVYYDSTTLSDSFEREFSLTLGFWMTPKRCGYGNTARTYTKGSTHPTGGLMLGGWDSGNPFTGKMSIIRIYGSDAQNATSFNDLGNYTDIATFRPCTYNGEAGMWYVQGNTFFGNTAGAGTLTVVNDE